MAKTQPEEQYTPRGAKIPIPEKGEFRRNLDRLLQAGRPPKRKSAGGGLPASPDKDQSERP